MDSNRIQAQIEYIRNTVEEIDRQYDNRNDDFDLHSLLGHALGAMKGVANTLEEINRQ